MIIEVAAFDRTDVTVESVNSIILILRACNISYRRLYVILTLANTYVCNYQIRFGFVLGRIIGNYCIKKFTLAPFFLYLRYF